MLSVSEALASLDRALAEADACKIATKPERPSAAKAHVTPTVPAGSTIRSLVGVSHPSTPHPSTPTIASTPHTPKQNSTPTDDTAPILSKRLQKAKAKSEPLLSVPWRKLRRDQKVARAMVVAQEQESISFTLNLSDEFQATLSDHPDPARLMSHYINRELKKEVGIAFPYAFRFEVSPTGRLHLHGVIIPYSFLEHHVEGIDRALAKAGGKLKADQLRRNTQSYLGTLWDGLGWFAYCEKTGKEVSRFLGTDKVTFISTPLVRMCRDRRSNVSAS